MSSVAPSISRCSGAGRAIDKAEALHERKVIQIADPDILPQGQSTHRADIGGASSSGKQLLPSE